MRTWVAAVLALASAAGAQERGPVERPGRARLVFIAPSGEPFRAPVGNPYPVAAWFAGADTNGDGRLTKAEFTADFERFFGQLDQGRKGRLTTDDIRRYENEVAPEVQALRGFGRPSGDGAGVPRGGARGSRSRGRHGGDDRGGGDQGSADSGAAALRRDEALPMGGGRYGLINIPEPVAAMDTDFNGVVTIEDVRAAAARRFALLDPQGRGYLTLATLPKTYAQVAAEEAAKRRAKQERRRGSSGGSR